MQHQNKSSSIFLERTDALAAALNVSIRELAERIGISQAMLFAYRSGKNPISEKAWRKLEEAEEAAKNKSTQIFHYAPMGEYQSAVGEPRAVYNKKPERVPFPQWWDRMPKSARDLEAALPHVHARLRLAAIIRHEADTNAVTRTAIHDSPLHDAFQDLGLCGTGFTMTPGFAILAEAYSALLADLRVNNARLEIAASKAAMETLLDKVLQVLGSRHLDLSTVEREEAARKVASLMAEAQAVAASQGSAQRHG